MMNLINLKQLMLCCIQPDMQSPFWQKLAEGMVSGFFTLLGLGIAACLAYRFALRQKRRETFIGLERTKYERKLNSLEECWKLLAYTTDTENAKTIFTWEQLKGGDKIYYLDKINAREYINNLAGFFYSSGSGIYLTKEIKELLFEYRSIIFGILLKENKNESNTIRVQNNEMVGKLIKIHQSLISELKKETEMIDKIENKK